jgi:hypothetical protein
MLKVGNELLQPIESLVKPFAMWRTFRVFQKLVQLYYNFAIKLQSARGWIFKVSFEKAKLF